MTQEFTIDDCSAGVRNAKPSEVRKVFAMSAKPGMISFASGMPELRSLPLDALADIASDLMRNRGNEVMQYGASTGTDHLKDQLIELMNIEGIENATRENTLVTTGSQNGLDTLARVMIDPGDVILAEAPSYSGAMAVFTGAQAEVVHVAIDHEGLIPEELEKTIGELESQGRRIKFLYTIPSFQNPGGTMMPQERRDRIREICAAHHVLIAEDNPYGLLGFEGQTARAMRADDKNVVYLGSVSKMFAPGLRVGWVVAPDSLSKILGLQSEAAVLNPSVFAQEVVAEYLEKYDWRSVLDEYRVLYGKRAQALMDAFDEHMPDGVTWTRPEGGFYSWITLPEDVDSYDLCMKCIDEGVVFVPGTAFYTDGRGEHEVRMSFCHPTEDEIRKGVEIFTTTLKKAMNA